MVEISGVFCTIGQGRRGRGKWALIYPEHFRRTCEVVYVLDGDDVEEDELPPLRGGERVQNKTGERTHRRWCVCLRRNLGHGRSAGCGGENTAGKTWIRDTRVRVRAAPTRAIESAALKQQIPKAPLPTLSRRSGARGRRGMEEEEKEQGTSVWGGTRSWTCPSQRCREEAALLSLLPPLPPANTVFRHGRRGIAARPTYERRRTHKRRPQRQWRHPRLHRRARHLLRFLSLSFISSLSPPSNIWCLARRAGVSL